MKLYFRWIIPVCLLGATGIMVQGQPGQVVIPRVELMPNQPMPYNMRDWKQVARRYDSLVYDVQLSGQYLPLTTIIPAGYNYPGRPFFRQHTYVGTNNPLGNEAINVLPSLIGATLVGIDKSNQFGQNWVLMSQDFFNRQNGERLYLNASATSSGNDWWYDMMPNVYFFQLYDLYPNVGGEAAGQFQAVADRMLEAVRGMGGADSPWSPAYMNYRAWRFLSGQPNPNGVPEPEAAGAFGWLLYHAWKRTQHAEYLKGAEWSMEFLNTWTSNPSYELQLPYGTYIAAKMNAEIGTTYNVEKMLNWSFNRGALRGWGTITGTWGGFNVSGLVGEANNNGNDYAFQLNGVQQAAALVPMVRYDKRFARAISKWVLNLSNATRLFYPGFLPASLQDASGWSSVNDPHQVMGYEALRQVWQGNSPYSTGDAVQGGWAATNLALYGTSSIGYLGAVVEKTNVDRILRLDLLATDFFREEAYPSFLYYNSYSTARQVQLDLGTGTFDLYESLSENFTHQDVSGVVTLQIPANAAIMVVVCPANGVITYERNKMLVDGVVVDYRQSAQPWTHPPRIKGLAVAQHPVQVGTQTTLYATVEDPDSDLLVYEWVAEAGMIEGDSATVAFLAPQLPGELTVWCMVEDPEGNRDTTHLTLQIVEEINLAPQIQRLVKSSPYVAPGESLQISCIAADPNPGDVLNYSWSTSGGLIQGDGPSIVWSATQSGIYEIQVTVSDAEGLTAISGTSILVRVFPNTSGNTIAHYPFTGNAQDISGNQLHGQNNGAILTADRFGSPQRAYFFNGGNQHIIVSNHPLLNFQQAITVSCWFRAAALPDRETFLLSHGSWQNRWKISITPDRKLRWTVNSLSGISDLDSELLLQQDSLYHITATYDGSLMAIYLNGELHHYKQFAGLIRTTSLPFLMAQMLPGDANYNFRGVLDEVQIMNYALHPTEVLHLYQSGLTTTSDIAGQGGQIHIYPNPADQVIRATLPALHEQIEEIRLFDWNGKLRLQRAGNRSRSMELSLKGFSSGTYIISIRTGQKVYHERLVIQTR